VTTSELFEKDECGVCGEGLAGDVAEMYDPATESGSVVCHAECGVMAGLQIA